MVASVILGLLTIAELIAAAAYEAQPLFALIPYLCYCCWSRSMPSSSYKGNCIELPQVFTDADRTIANKPRIMFNIECYHYEKSNKKERKVVTYNGSKEFVINYWMDQSPPSYTLNYLGMINLARLKTDK